MFTQQPPGDLAAYIDVENALKRIQDNKSLYLMLLDSFAKSTSHAQMIQAVADEDFDEGALHAHSIKGIAANLSMEALREQAFVVESDLKVEIVNPEHLDALEVILTQTLEYIRWVKENLMG